MQMQGKQPGQSIVIRTTQLDGQQQQQQQQQPQQDTDATTTSTTTTDFCPQVTSLYSTTTTWYIVSE